MTFVIH